MKKIIIFFILLALFTPVVTAANGNTIEIIIESSKIHNDIENIIDDFKLDGVFLKNFNEKNKILILSNDKYTLIEKIGEEFKFKEEKFIIKEVEHEYFVYSSKEDDLFKKLEKNF